MHLRLNLRILAALAALMTTFLLLPAGLAIILGESPAPFLSALAVSAGLVLAFFLPSRGAPRALSTRDGFIVVTSGWIVASAISALPFVFAGALAPTDAWFEAVSGITTTGSTVITDIEALPQSLLFWRSFTQWIGGMGIILFTIAILPPARCRRHATLQGRGPGARGGQDRAAAGRHGTLSLVHLRRPDTGRSHGAEVGRHAPSRSLRPCLHDPRHGGLLSPRNASIAAYASPYLRAVIIVFMFMAGMNFVLHFKVVSGRGREVLRDPEFRWYITLTLVFFLPTWIGLAAHGAPLLRAGEDALFTVVSLMTTTGYATADYELWPVGMQGPIVLLLILGGMAGSTGGGVKTLRTLLAFRGLRSSFRRMESPHAVRPVTYHGRAVPPEVMAAVWGFFAAYLTLAAIGSLILNAGGIDLVTSWSAALTALGNVGPGLAGVGPTDHFAWLSAYDKLVLSFLMLCGRLELYTVLLVFSPGFWRR
ncbi:MAG: TrkH family potassium uptake protein [Acidobacteriota bacterium]|nr:TrkH family potassium uptake protein [Acidobacteriota bacterium]